MSQSHSSAISAPVPTLKIHRTDWKRLPAWFKRQIGGVPSVLSRQDGVAAFVPVQIL